MTISTVSSFLNLMSPGAASTARQIPPGPAPTDSTPRELGESGFTPFNHRHLIDGLKDKFRAQVMAEKDMDSSTLNAMSSEQRGHVEAEIGRQVDQKLRETMERTAQDAARGGKAEGALLNIRA